VTEPIHDSYTEAAVLSCILAFNRSLDDVIEILEPQHFGRRHHGAIYSAMLALHRQGKPIDQLTVVEQAKANGDASLAGLPEVAALSADHIRLSNIAAHAQIIRDKALRRDIRSEARQMIADAESDDIKATELLEKAESALFHLGHQTVRTEWVSGAELVSQVMPLVEELGKANGSAVTGLATGFPEIDRMTRGLQRGDLVLVGARPSMGKTAYGLQIAMHAAKTVPVAVFSIEMALQPVGMRAVIGAADVDGFRLLSGGHMSDVELRRLNLGIDELAAASVFFDESPSVSPLHVRSKLRRLRSRCGQIGLVVIDYLQLMAPLPEHARENKTNQVAGISRALKVLAREMNVPFLVLSQLNRGLEHKGEKRPTMADLRDSGALEQDADVIFLLHRPHYYDANAPADLAEVIIAKQRNGPTGIVSLEWRAPQMTFGNPDDKYRRTA